MTSWPVATVTDTPPADVDGLATAVLSATGFAGPDRRRALAERLARSVDGSRSARNAVRTLLVGRPIPPDAIQTELVSPTSERERESLAILLGIVGQPWRLVAGEVLRSFSEEQAELLGVRRVTSSTMQLVVQRAVDAQPAAWESVSEDDARRLLLDLHTALRDRPDLWERLPLHRFEDGSRGALEEGVWRAGDGLAGLPDDLRAALRILDPDPPVAGFYEGVPVLDEEGLLRAMLTATDSHRFVERILDALAPLGRTT